MLWNQEFLNENENRAYPLAEAATAQDKTGTFTLPTSFLCELSLPVPVSLTLGTTINPAKFFLGQITVLPSGYTVVISYDDGTDAPPAVAQATIAAATHTELDEYTLTGLGEFADVTGSVVIGRTDEIDLQPAGAWLFDADGGRLDTDCIRPFIQGVSSITLVNGHDTSAKITGDILFTAGTNFRLVLGGDNIIRFDAIDGAGLTASCDCDGETPLPPPLRTINGIPGDAHGNFTLRGNTCLTIDGIDNGLQLSDVCSAPCCGCPELDALTRELAYFGNEATALKGFVNRLSGSFGQFDTVVLASKLNSTPCA